MVETGGILTEEAVMKLNFQPLQSNMMVGALIQV